MVKKRPDKVHFMCNGFQTDQHINVVEDFFQIIKNTDESFLPKKVSICETKGIPFSIEEANTLWAKSKEEIGFHEIDLINPKYTGSITWGPKNSNEITFWIKTDMITNKNGTSKFLELAKSLFLWSNSVYGFASHISKLGGLPGPGLTYETCLGDIGWMTLFGPPYVKMFGREVIETAPCKVEEFAENYFILLTSDQPIETTPDLLEIQEKVKIHLGEQAFARKDRYKGPLTIEGLMEGKHIRSTEGYRSPDLLEYKGNSMGTDKDGLIALVNDDASIDTYKITHHK